MTPRADLLDEVKPPGKIKYVAAASGALLPVIGVGNAKVKGANGELVGLGNVLLVEAVNMLRAFGCMVVFHVPKEKRGKLEASGR
ncbi:hypothetical protein CLOM_g12284 [Closterium sp. NIES-68]|nr:hypothetical protein CLOM_g12284 [Closterium sp. NIES-68]